MFELFSDIFTYRDNCLARVDARAKLVISFAALIFVILSNSPKLPLLVAILCLGGIALLRVPPKLVVLRFAGPLGISAVLVIIQSLMVGSKPLFHFSVAGQDIAIMREGLTHGILLGSRVIGAVSVMLLMSFVTPAHKIFQALHYFRVPGGWLEIAVLMYRYIFGLMDRVEDLGSSQRLRLGYIGLRRSLASAGTLAGATILHSLDQAKCTSEAMALRGYRGQLPFGPMPAMSGRDRYVMVLSLLVLSVVFALFERRLV